MVRAGGLVAALLGLLLWLRLRRHFAALPPRRRKVFAAVSGIALLAACFPGLAMAVGGWSGMRVPSRHLPEDVALTLFAAQFAVFFEGLLFGIRRAAMGLTGLARRTRARPPAPAPVERALEVTAPPPPVDQDRRRIVAGALVLPAIAVGGSACGVLSARGAPVVTRLALPVRRELTALHGITIAQISDLHVGSYMDAERLDEIRDALNALRADYHVITGDLLDNHVSQLELSARLVRELRPRRGEVFLCMGNHEYIAARTADVKTIVAALEEAGGQVLIDEARAVRVGGDHLWMGAIDYPSRSGRGTGRPVRTTRESLDLALAAMRDDGAPRILLSHHPRAFIQARELPMDLMLAGHTHGGQFKLGRIGDHAITPMLPIEPYHNGHYEHRGRRLYVNSGAGGWLPVRVNCPPEITLVELVAA